MPHCYWCNHDFIARKRYFDHWIDIFNTRASIVCPSCNRHFEVWACELSSED